MKFTKKQKDAIKAQWPSYPLRFLADGTVVAKTNRMYGNAWTTLLSPRQSKEYVENYV
jgi:hypothetical protein